jgi:hypothetical protein
MKFKEAHNNIKEICCYKGEADENKCEYIFCKLHEPEYLGNHEGSHVCIGCMLDDSISKIDRFLSEVHLIDEESNENIDYIFTNFILLTYLTVEKLHTIFKFIGITYEYVEVKWPVLIEIRKWANFVKHPKGFLFTHHPDYIFEYDQIDKNDKSKQFIDFDIVSKFYFREDETKWKQTLNEIANKDNIIVILPNPERLMFEFVQVCRQFCDKIKINEHFKEILKTKVILVN